MASRGLTAKDAVAALIPTLELAKIANINAGHAADIVAKSLAAFGLPATAAQERLYIEQWNEAPLGNS